MRLRSTMAATLLATAACAPAAAPSPAGAPASSAAAPADALSALEARLLAARSFRLKARTATSGRITSHFDATVVAGEGSRVRLDATGSFGNRDVGARWVCDGRTMTGGSAEGRFSEAAPPALREGLVVDFVRRGLTHDLARLSAGKLPEGLDGHAREHLAVVAAVHGDGGALNEKPSELWSWTLVVDGRPEADEHLWLDAATGLPLRRRITVHFPEGDMDVAEDYDALTLDAPEPDATFAP